VPAKSPDQLPASLQLVYQIWANKDVPNKLFGGGFIDVEDVATAHLWAHENPNIADGQRYYTVGGYGPPQAQADFLRNSFPDRKISEGTPKSDYAPGTDWNGRSVGTGIQREVPNTLGRNLPIRQDWYLSHSISHCLRPW
jgi:nucleoside-diphosphate-sugar epimerase